MEGCDLNEPTQVRVGCVPLPGALELSTLDGSFLPHRTPRSKSEQHLPLESLSGLLAAVSMMFNIE